MSGRILLTGIVCVTLIVLMAGSVLRADEMVLKSVDPLESPAEFTSAKPVWPQGQSLEKNLFVGFRKMLPKSDKPFSLRITGSSVYRVLLDGRLVGYGPARAAHGYYRVDNWQIPAANEESVLCIEVAGYNVNSYYLLDQPAFVQAELLSDGEPVAATGLEGKDFEAFILNERVQKVQRYSFQRPFIEYYRMGSAYGDWLLGDDYGRNSVNCEVLENRKLLPRRIDYPIFGQISPARLYSKGRLSQGNEVEQIWRDRSLVNIGPALKGYKLEELELVLSDEVQKIETESKNVVNKDYEDRSESPEKNGYRIYDFGNNLTGFIELKIKCDEPCKVVLTFDELISNKDVNFLRLGCVNAVGYELEPGSYELMTFEPYTLQYLKVMVLKGECEISNVRLTEYVCPGTDDASFACPDENLENLFEAARQTYRQNTLDVFMDCPHRERAGWLCDSFFTARVARDITGKSVVEKVFFENYLLPDEFEYLPDGMLPMCYPADHNDGVYIPNWAMWFVLQLEEYLNRTGDAKMVADLQPRVRELLTFLAKYENSDGLLENLPSWVFIEWSAANSFVQDVNYPSNMLYSAVLDAASRMLHDSVLAEKSEKIREVIREQSFDGTFFVDNAMRDGAGELKVTRNRTEVCQYFAFYFDVATPRNHSDLWKKLITEFGPKRKETKAYPEVHPANAFVGNYLRMELLSEAGLIKQLRSEMTDHFLEMAATTGTLWENMSPSASCNHGFASHVVHSLYRDILGIYKVDDRKKKVTLRLRDSGLQECSGTLMTPDGAVSLCWRRNKDGFNCTIEMPPDYKVNIHKDSEEAIRLEPAWHSEAK